jgi:hypothetical protein
MSNESTKKRPGGTYLTLPVMAVVVVGGGGWWMQ